MHAGGSYPGSGLSVEITPLVLLCGGLRMITRSTSGYKRLLELFGERKKEGQASSLLL